MLLSGGCPSSRPGPGYYGSGEDNGSDPADVRDAWQELPACFRGDCDVIDVAELPRHESASQEFPLTGICQPGQAVGLSRIRIQDDPDNNLLPACGPQPGADIDAVCLFSPSWDEKGCAGTVQVEEGGPACDGNLFDDPNELLGQPDGVDEDAASQGFYSLNGRAVLITIHDDSHNEVELLCGDHLYVWEMYNPEDPSAAAEKYKVDLGTADGLWSIESNWSTGQEEFVVIWYW